MTGLCKSTGSDLGFQRSRRATPNGDRAQPTLMILHPAANLLTCEKGMRAATPGTVTAGPLAQLDRLFCWLELSARQRHCVRLFVRVAGAGYVSRTSARSRRCWPSCWQSWPVRRPPPALKAASSRSHWVWRRAIASAVSRVVIVGARRSCSGGVGSWGAQVLPTSPVARTRRSARLPRRGGFRRLAVTATEATAARPPPELFQSCLQHRPAAAGIGYVSYLHPISGRRCGWRGSGRPRSGPWVVGRAASG
ncbi:hypothetical protein SAMN05660874_05002 [Saccharopolyspora flava]|uniref:Uncharacterized protein n=1 Tax=Saccharopolyspora flava TaxID=95161 RepID=A0A1I6UK13_9PSEU|nr:hypothetical protein SAMN05660874_05002 [Saccharopolyspora flava]